MTNPAPSITVNYRHSEGSADAKAAHIARVARLTAKLARSGWQVSLVPFLDAA